MNTNVKSVAFYERGSWYHRTKELNKDYTIKYGKIGGFKTQQEAEESYKMCKEKFEKELTSNHLMIDKEVMMSDYLIYWFEHIFRERDVSSNYEVGVAYVIYNFIIPLLKQDEGKANIKLKFANTDYFNSILEELSKITESAGNKCSEILNLAMKDARANEYINNNPMENAKKYYRKKPKIKILNESELKKLLKEAKESSWYLEILLATFCGLRKGEIMGLKFTDFNLEKQTIKIDRQLVRNAVLNDNSNSTIVEIENYKLIETPPKKNSYRTLRVPKIIVKEMKKRIEKLNIQKEMYSNFEDDNYVSFQEKVGKTHSPNSLNTYLKRACTKLNITCVTVHGLRHIFATILIEQGVPIEKIAALLGHSNPHTTFEIYCDVMEEREKILEFINNKFSLEKMEV